MSIRRARAEDLPGVRTLLFQVNQIHADGRPDLFKDGGIKYNDLCVAEEARGRHIGRMLYERVLQAARELDCRRVTLHAWNFNQKALGFYEKLGMKPLVTTMEQMLT